MYRVMEMWGDYWILVQRKTDPNAWTKISTCADEQEVQEFVKAKQLHLVSTGVVKTLTGAGRVVEHSTRWYQSN